MTRKFERHKVAVYTAGRSCLTSSANIDWDGNLGGSNSTTLVPMSWVFGDPFICSYMVQKKKKKKKSMLA